MIPNPMAIPPEGHIEQAKLLLGGNITIIAKLSEDGPPLPYNTLAQRVAVNTSVAEAWLTHNQQHQQ